MLEALPVAAGALAMAVGAEDGTPTAAVGVVSRAAGPWRSLRGGEIEARIELDLRLRRSAEGGPTLNAVGQAIGMAVFGPRRRVLVIPSATIERVAAKLENYGRIARGYIGLGLQPVALQGDGELGVMVMSVDPEGPGAAAVSTRGISSLPGTASRSGMPTRFCERWGRTVSAKRSRSDCVEPARQDRSR